MNLELLLQSLGLSKTQAQLYLAALQLGPSSAIQLGQKLNFSRQLMYDLLPGMIERGFIKQVTVGKRHFFQAVDPQVLNDMTKKLQQDIAAAIPQFKQQQAASSAVPAITVYDNPLSMREWYRSFMEQAKTGEEKLIYSTEAGWFDLDPEFYESFAKFQIKKKTKNRIIAPDRADTRAVAEKVMAGSQGVHNYRFAPEGWHGESAKWIWRNQIIHLTLRGKATNLIVIESEELAAIERFAFERTWNSLS